MRYLKRLLDEAKEFAERMQAKETITRGDVELAMQEKLHIIKSLEDEEKELNSKIKLVDEMLESKNDDLTRMRRYQVREISSLINNCNVIYSEAYTRADLGYKY